MLRPLWRDIRPVFDSYFDGPYAEDVTPLGPEDYLPWAKRYAPNFQRANRGNVILAVVDYILTHPEFSVVEFMGYVAAGAFDNDDEYRRVLEIMREVAFPDAPPVPVPEVMDLDVTGLSDRTPSTHTSR